jgi:hypothetical protein
VSAARRPSSATRRTLLTATASGTLLAALWFVPSANATQDGLQQRQLTSTTATGADTSGAGTADMTTRTSADALTASDSSPTDDGDGTSTDGTTGTGTAGAEGTTTSTGRERQLADTGSFDTTPYVVGGTLSLALGAGFVAYSVRRERMA